MKLSKLNYFLLVLSGICGLTLSQKARFDNYRVYSLRIDSQNDAKVFSDLETFGNGYEIWNNPAIGQNLDILVPPQKIDEFEELLRHQSITSVIKIQNLQKLIDNEESRHRVEVGELDWTSYHTLDEIYSWLDVLLKNYSNILTPETVGFSYHGTEIRAVRLSYKPNNKAILIEANIHAREWITSATATWVLNELLTSSDPDARDLAENVDWYIIPVSNPDGFNYTKSTYRLWRKTRYPHSHLCYGVDGNRNFDFQWMHVGASANPCEITYAGPRPFSEPETKALADFYLKHKAQVAAYLAFHSYSQYVLLPYGYTHDKHENYEGMLQVGNAAVAAIYQRHHTKYMAGSTAELLYMNSGSSRDWAAGVHNVSVAYTIEFRDQGKYGFILPPDQIIPNSEEIFDGLKAIVKESRSLGYL